MLGALIGFIFTVILVGVGGFFLYQRVTVGSMFGPAGVSQPGSSPSQQQQGSQSNSTLFGCPELKLVGAETVKSGVPFTIQNTDSKPHKINISITEYSFTAGEKKTITIPSGQTGAYHPMCDGINVGELNVE